MDFFFKVLAGWRKATPVLFLLSIVFLPQITFGAENYKAGDKLYVAPTSGVHVRTSPAITAPVLVSLDFNTVVTVVVDSLSAKPFQIAVNDFNDSKIRLQGHWVKVRTGKITCYVFDGLLSKFRGLPLGTYEEEPYYVTLFGTPTLKSIQKSTVIKGRKLEYKTEITSYPRDLVMESTFFDDCYNEVYTFGMSFNEAYWLIKRMMLNADAAQEIKLKKENNKTILSYYSCT